MKYGIYALTTLLLLTGAIGLDAQEYYTFSRSAGIYTPLTNPMVTLPGPDTNNYNINGLSAFQMDIYGFPMMLRDQNSLVIFKDGFVAIPTVDPTGRGVVFVLEGFYAQLTNRDATSARLMAVELADGDLVMKFEWRNMGLAGHPAGDFVNFQLWLKKSDNSVEMHMGPNKVTATNGFFGGQSGPVIGVSLLNQSLDTTFHTVHLSGPANNPVQTDLPFTTITGTPVPGLIYRFAYNKPASVAGSGVVASGVAFHPNPFHESTRIELPEDLSGHATMLVHDLLGREVLNISNPVNGDMIPRGSLPAGIYLVTLQEQGRSRSGGRLVITE